MQLCHAVFMLISAILDAILIFSNHVMMPECRHAAFELAWSDESERGQEEKCIFGFTYTYNVDFCGIFSHWSAILNISKCSMMPRWHHSVSSSERCQEVKIIKTFYAAQISRSQPKSMFGNWTIPEKSEHQT